MPRARKEPAPNSTPLNASGAARRWIIQLFLPLALGAGLLVGVVLLGRYLTARLQDAGELMVAFTDIDCAPPPGMTRVEFLGEAQYLAGLPDQLNVLDPQTRQRMFDALALHPWVARVRRLDLTSPTRARAELEYRRPALVVAGNRVVDEEGVLLPQQASPKGLPRLMTSVRPPSGRAGQLWQDPIVSAAARVAAVLHEALIRRGGDAACIIEIRSGEVILKLGRTRIVWGRPPGQEAPDEAAATMKVSRLAEAGPLDGQEWDLRPQAGLRRKRIEP